MASIRLIRRRIRSAGNIAQITRAMQMVAASKMRRAIEAAQLGKLYADSIYTATRQLAARTESSVHPLLGKGNPEGHALVILISTNKGLCGGLNTTLFRNIMEWFPHPQTEFVTIGKKGESFIVRTGKTLTADFSATVPFLESVPAVTQLLVTGFLEGKYSTVSVAYSGFINALKQVPTRRLILPLGGFTKTQDVSEDALRFGEFVVEPSIDDVLSHLLPHYLENQLRSSILEAEASEHSARMIAMKNATDAASDFMEALTHELNRARQEKITYEIADMVTARMAVS